MTSHRLNGPALYRQMNALRLRRGLSWRTVTRALKCPPGTFTNLRTGESGLHGDSLVAALVWLGLDREVTHLIDPLPGPAAVPLEGQAWPATHDRLVEQLCTLRPGLRPEQAHATLQALRTLRWELRPPTPAGGGAVCGERGPGLLDDSVLVCVKARGHEGRWHQDRGGAQFRSIDNNSAQKQTGG